MREFAGKKFFDEAEATVRLGYRNRMTLWRARKAGRLDHYRIGGNVYYSEENLQAFLENCRVSHARQDAA